MKKIFVIVSFVILSVSGLSAQVKFDTFISKIYYGMTESDLVQEFGDDMQYYASDDTTDNKVSGHNLAKLKHKLNLIENFYTITDLFSDYEINLQIDDHDIPFTISLDSLSMAIKTFVFASSLSLEILMNSTIIIIPIVCLMLMRTKKII